MPIGAFEIPCPRKPEALNCGASALLPDDSEDDYHAESCSPVGSAVPQSPFITMGRTRHLRRTCNVVFEEMRICGALQQHLEDLNSNVPFEELWQPIHVAAHLGDDRAACFFLLNGVDPEQKTSTGKSALDLAVSVNRRGSHEKVIALLSASHSEDQLLQLWAEED
ncbi:unnamed protein product [Durusdinium trenchii]|uniref:Uncharacterized protein n=1 Tax=Durusdinium trenchii TaxID=1381693 RepID=A0ABP0JG03_9DINO